MPDQVPAQIRPAHYGGADSAYEAIKVIEAWALNFSLGNAIKYICRAGKKPLLIDVTRVSDAQPVYIPDMNVTARIQDLRKARTYLDFEIARLERGDK